jgi:hypothetical protein
MTQDVVVVFVHGINVTCQDYYEPLRDRILAALPRKDREHLIFRAVFWADIVRGRQQEYVHYAKTSSLGFNPTLAHRMVIEGLGDAAAYQKIERKNSAYYAIQERIRKTIEDVALGRKDERPLVFITHSLGCHIVSSYAWDLHQCKEPELAFGDKTPDKSTQSYIKSLTGKTALERLDTFAGFVTMGSNMPLFTFSLGPQHVFPITKPQHETMNPAFPGCKLPTHVKDGARWLNFYSVNDPLGYPMKPLNDDYDQEKRLGDHHTHSEGWLLARICPARLRPLLSLRAHGGYWRDRKVARAAADMLHDIIHAAPAPPEPSTVKLFPTVDG